ncbi:asparagine synthase (glutamine-hydrolyzing) [Nitrospira moscoviensis]|uniref:asparagine synthase (glutamine-hydrolyzing) n=1 Tax=Nitrospira moscoviensis TaxID=42253 RepID=A0A0K2GJL2_NITMO|nr:asparagine synthase (glutamine-hydrolyzing) [Nitrospira moscoviensis]ALA61143.1 Asparagine synthetase [Nitrospira moscoviensis]
MCGIVGVFDTAGRGIAEEHLAAMRDCMVQRGPDDAGLFIHRDSGLFVGLGHRRLSIIDLSPLGRQPMSTADGSLRIVFNGEIFNYRELRRLLSESGRYAFRSHTDTEVVLYGVREWGLDGCLKRLRGMYAFALFDQTDGSLTLVRDPLGVKPLYYSRQPAGFVFASEIKAILAAPGAKAALNDEALYHYLTFANAPAPLTFFEGIQKLEAGTYLRIDRRGRPAHTRFWDPAAFVPGRARLTEPEAVAELRRLLRQSVARRMVSDVPFGAFLSGGVDSSLNVALMAELLDKPVETFSIGIKGDASNEFEHARQVAGHFGARHHELVIDEDDFLHFLPKMPYAQDEPLADPVCVPIYYLSKLAHNSGTLVIQVGEGSDELFAGYRTYHQFAGWESGVFSRYKKLPLSLRRIVAGAAAGRAAPELADACRRAAEDEPLFLGNAIAFWDGEKDRLLQGGRGACSTSGRWIAELMRDLPAHDPLLRIINVELKNRLPELLLMRVDKMSMAQSIETRVPFLDEDLVEFALTIPSDLKYKKGKTKYLLKQAARGIIPDEIIDRKKWGFCGSATNMLTGRLASFAQERVSKSRLIRERFDAGEVRRLFESHRHQPRFNSFKIWNLLNLVLWHECWFE